MDYERIKEQIIWDRIKQMYNDMDDAAKSQVERVFPELKESEDERIRKEIIEFIDINTLSIDERHDRWIAWLEAQGEQKPVVTPKFKVGDKVMYKPQLRMSDDDTPLRNTIREIVSIEEGWYKCDNGCSFNIEDQDNYELVEQKPAWSEEDEKVLHAIRNALNYEKPRNYLKSRDLEFLEVLDWLKSLRPQNTWKPSEEQMEALKGVQEGVFRLGILESLYNDLMKLKGG